MVISLVLRPGDAALLALEERAGTQTKEDDIDPEGDRCYHSNGPVAGSHGARGKLCSSVDWVVRQSYDLKSAQTCVLNYH